MEKKMRKHMLTACEAGHMSLFCPELPRRSRLLMSTVWHMSQITTSTSLRGFNEIITKGSGGSTIGTRNRRPGMALLSARRKTSQTFEITSRALERRIHWKKKIRKQKDKSKNKKKYHRWD